MERNRFVVTANFVRRMTAPAQCSIALNLRPLLTCPRTVKIAKGENRHERDSREYMGHLKSRFGRVYVARRIQFVSGRMRSKTQLCRRMRRRPKISSMGYFRSTIAAAAVLAAHPAAAEDHRFEADPVAIVHENFVACEVLSQLQRVIENPRFLLADECVPLRAGDRSVSTQSVGHTSASIRTTRSRPTNGRIRKHYRNEGYPAKSPLRTIRMRASKNSKGSKPNKTCIRLR
jgi:hypothetical protein